MEKTVINECMAICSDCFYEFDLHEAAYIEINIDIDDGYICADCKEEKE